MVYYEDECDSIEWKKIIKNNKKKKKKKKVKTEQNNKEATLRIKKMFRKYQYYTKKDWKD